MHARQKTVYTDLYIIPQMDNPTGSLGTRTVKIWKFINGRKDIRGLIKQRGRERRIKPRDGHTFRHTSIKLLLKFIN